MLDVIAMYQLEKSAFRLRLACSELVATLKRASSTSTWLVLFSLVGTIVKWSHLVVSASFLHP